VEFSESLLADNHDMHITPEDFENLFAKDNLNNIQNKEKVSISLHKLESRYRGVEGVAKTLNSDVKKGIPGTDNDI